MKGKTKAPMKTERKAVAADAKKGGKSPFEQKVEPGEQKVSGAAVKRRLDRPGRKTGGRVGADSAPLSQAAKNTGGRMC